MIVRCLGLLLLATPLLGACSTSSAQDSLAHTGHWKLQSSKLGEALIASPKWKGQMLIIDGRYSRFYTRVSGTDSMPFDTYSDGGGYAVGPNQSLVLTVEYSNYPPSVGQIYNNTYVLESGNKRLHLKGENFEESWVKP